MILEVASPDMEDKEPREGRVRLVGRWDCRYTGEEGGEPGKGSEEANIVVECGADERRPAEFRQDR